MTDHELKIIPRYYSDVVRFAKRFEARRNDRGFKKGDRVVLREWDGTSYTGREAGIEITYVLTSEDFPEAIKEGYCVFGFWLMDVTETTEEADGHGNRGLPIQPREGGPGEGDRVPLCELRVL